MPWQVENPNLPNLPNPGLSDPSFFFSGSGVLSQSCNIIEAPFVFSIASVRGGPLTIALSWQEDVIETEMAEKVRNALSAEMERIISTTGVRDKTFYESYAE